MAELSGEVNVDGEKSEDEGDPDITRSLTGP